MRDIANNVNLRPAFVPGAAVTDNTVQTSTILDTYGYGSAMLGLVTGTLTDADATFTVAISESNDSGMAGSNAVAATDLVGTSALASFNFANSGVCRKIGYIGAKRFIQATITPAANTGNLFVAGVWILGKPVHAPTANPPN
jgi:hypothetical protein